MLYFKHTQRLTNRLKAHTKTHSILVWHWIQRKLHMVHLRTHENIQREKWHKHKIKAFFYLKLPKQKTNILQIHVPMLLSQLLETCS